MYLLYLFERCVEVSFNKKVVKILKEKKKTKAQLAKAAGIPYTTLDSMLKRDSDATRLVTIYKIAEYLDVPVEELVFDDESLKGRRKTELTDTELSIIDSFRSVDERAKNTILALVDYETARQNKLTLLKEQQEDKNKIPVYMSPAAAGEPLPILADDYYLVNASKAPSDASFGIKISGDSMEPIISDSSVVWVKKQDVIDNGDVGVFVLNGESLCKKLDNTNGKCKLVSYNAKYAPIEVLDTDDLRVVGKVIL